MNHLSAATVKREVLDPSLEAQAHNDRQTLLKVNLHTPEPDSVIEHCNAIIARPHDPDHVVEHVTRIVTLTTDDLESNLAERSAERAISGFADQAVRAIHAATLNGTLRIESYRAVANRLRPHLAVIASPREHDAVAYFTACRTVSDVLAASVPAQLFTAALKKDLGDGPYRLLVSLHESRSGVRSPDREAV